MKGQVGSTMRPRARAALGAIAAAAFLVLPTTASAVTQNISVKFGPTQTATTNAGDQTEYTLTFDVPSGLNESHVIVVNAAGMGLANGTFFPDGSLPSAPAGTVYSAEAENGSGGVVLAHVVRQNGNQTVAIPLFGTGISAAPGDTVTVGIGYFAGPKVQNPLVPCTCRLAVRTQTQTSVVVDDFGVSAAYDVVEGPGDLLRQAGNNQSASVADEFDTELSVKLVDGLGAPVQGEDIEFNAPANGPSGTFAGGTNGGLTYTTQTDASGIATASVLTANGEAGNWQATAEAPNVAGVNSVTFSLENEVGEADSVDLELNPTVVEGNGVSTIEATATVVDVFGNRVDGDTVVFDTDGGQDVSATVPINNGQYRATITSTPEAGLFTATAADTSAGIADGEQFLQTQDSTPPGVKILDKPKKRTESKKVKFVFDPKARDADKLECKLDKRNFKKCNSPKKYKVKVGQHTFKVRATDQAGNTGQPAKYEFKRVKKN